MIISTEKSYRLTDGIISGAMKRLCAWCGKDLDPSIPSEVSKTTHGICVSCANELILKEKLRLQRLVDRLELLQE